MLAINTSQSQLRTTHLYCVWHLYRSKCFILHRMPHNHSSLTCSASFILTVMLSLSFALYLSRSVALSLFTSLFFVCLHWFARSYKRFSTDITITWHCCKQSIHKFKQRTPYVYCVGKQAQSFHIYSGIEHKENLKLYANLISFTSTIV